MRLLIASLFCFLCFQPLMAQSDIAQKFTAVLATHPDKDAVKTLKGDIESGQIKVTLGEQTFLASTKEWDRVAARVVFKLVSQKTLTLPNGFFSYVSCIQEILVEVLGLGYDYISKLPGDQTNLLVRFANPELVEDVDEKDQERLYKLVTGFEVAAIENTDRFSKLLFQACSQPEINLVLDAKSPTSAENFASTAKDVIRKQFEGLRLLIQQ